MKLVHTECKHVQLNACIFTWFNKFFYCGAVEAAGDGASGSLVVPEILFCVVINICMQTLFVDNLK